jgi:hypothetical protein
MFKLSQDGDDGDHDDTVRGRKVYARPRSPWASQGHLLSIWRRQLCLPLILRDERTVNLTLPLSWVHNTAIFAGQATAPRLNDTLFAM